MNVQPLEAFLFTHNGPHHLFNFVNRSSVCPYHVCFSCSWVINYNFMKCSTWKYTRQQSSILVAVIVPLIFLTRSLPGAESWPPPSDPSFEASPYEITPVLPASSGDRQLLPEDPTSYFLELLLDCMVSQAPKIHWNDGSQMWSRSIEFLYEKFKVFVFFVNLWITFYLKVFLLIGALFAKNL